MAATHVPVRSEADILPEWRETPVGELLRIHNLGTPASRVEGPRLLIARCLEHHASLRLPADFAVTVFSGAASLKRMPFKASWAVGVAGVRAIALVAHGPCGMTGLTTRREEFVQRLVEVGGWARSAAEQHFDHWSDLFEVEDAADFVLAEARRLAARYPRLPVAALYHDEPSDELRQLVAA